MPIFGAQVGHLNLPRVPDLSAIVGFVHRSVLAQDTPNATLVRRIPSAATSSAASTCTDNSTADTCAKPTNTSLGLPIGLGVAIPLVAAAIVLFVLHQRNKKRQRIEDRRDEEKYKSLDFGTSLHFSDGRRKKKGGNARRDDPGNRRQMRGLSMEAGPYMFPDSLHDSRASLHSLSRNAAFDEFSPYRPADEISLRAGSPGPRMRGDNGSVASSTLRKHDVLSRTDSANTSNTNLLRHPQPPPKSLPPKSPPPKSPPPKSLPPVPWANPNSPQLPSPDTFPLGTNDVGLAPPPAAHDRDSYFEKKAQDMRHSTNYLAAFIQSHEQSSEQRNQSTKDSELVVDAGPSSYSGSNVESAGSTLVNNSPNQTTPQASVSESDTPQITTSDYDSMPHAIPQPPEAPPKDTPLPSAKTLPSAKSLPSIPRPVRKQSLEQTQQTPPPPPKDRRQAPPPKPLPPQPNEHYQGRYSGQSQASADQSNNYSSHQTNSYISDASSYGDYAPRDSSSSYHSVGNRGQATTNPMPVLEEYPQPPPEPEDCEVGDVDHDSRRLSVFMRPLPPDDPNDTPEVRANRIRSFYKEYFDRSGEGGMQQYPQGIPSKYQLPPGEYYDYEDYTQEYMNAATVYDSEAGGFVVGSAPYAEPVTRRAMTPPPRAPPRFRGNGPPSRAGSRPPSNQAWNMPPRGQSAMSYRGRHLQPKPMPPPSALTSLPSPHLLKADSVLTALDFAPPVSFRDRQAGRRPDSPLGTPRPFSPSVRAHVPLTSSFDDLAAIPSPHALRKSGVYTSLDFAPPKRFKSDDAMSDAGSVRSGVSAVSSQQLYAMRTGAYRVSRIPKELAGSKDDIIASLRPTWDLRGPEQAARKTGRDSPAAFSTLRFT